MISRTMKIDPYKHKEKYEKWKKKIGEDDDCIKGENMDIIINILKEECNTYLPKEEAIFAECFSLVK